MPTYKVLHTRVGAWPQGRVITDEDIKAIEGCDVNRLLELKAIEKSGEPPTEEPLPPGPENPVKLPGEHVHPQESTSPEPEVAPHHGAKVPKNGG